MSALNYNLAAGPPQPLVNQEENEMLDINHSPSKFLLQSCMLWTPVSAPPLSVPTGDSKCSSLSHTQTPGMKGVRCFCTIEQDFGNLLLLGSPLQVTQWLKQAPPKGSFASFQGWCDLSPLTKEVMASADNVPKAGEMFLTLTYTDALQWP